jgi:deoxyadenosine/deoxycytidine kinase
MSTSSSPIPAPARKKTRLVTDEKKGAVRAEDVIIISLDGNIGAGKSTLLNAIRERMSDEVEIVQEPVDTWEALRNDKGESLLTLFYNDKKRWSYTFQNAAILTRLDAIKNAVKSAKKKILISERSVLTDRYVFAEMLYDGGDINELEWQIYNNWFDTFARELPMRGVIHLTTGVETSADRIKIRGREGESSIPNEYLSALDAQHHKWLSNTDLKVLHLSTENGVSVDDNVTKIREYIRECAFLDTSDVMQEAEESQEKETVDLKKGLKKSGLTEYSVNDKENVANANSASPFTINRKQISI